MSTTSAAFAFNSASSPDDASPSDLGGSEDSPEGLPASEDFSVVDSEYQREAVAVGLLNAFETAGRAECVNVRDDREDVAARRVFMTDNDWCGDS